MFWNLILENKYCFQIKKFKNYEIQKLPESDSSTYYEENVLQKIKCWFQIKTLQNRMCYTNDQRRLVERSKCCITRPQIHAKVLSIRMDSHHWVNEKHLFHPYGSVPVLPVFMKLRRDTTQHNPMQYITWHTFLRKLIDVICKKALCKEEDANVRIYPSLRALCRASNKKNLPFVFVQIEDSAMRLLKKQKSTPLPLECIYLEDAGTTRVGHVTLVPWSKKHMFIKFGASSLNENAEDGA